MRAIVALLVLLAFAAPLSAGGGSASVPPGVEGGRFGHFAAGREAGSEIVTVTRHEDRLEVESRVEMARADRTQRLSLTMTLSPGTGEVLAFSAKGVAGDRERVITLARDEGRLRGEIREGHDRRDLDLPVRSFVVAEPFAAPWLFLAAAYDRERGGAQEFPVLYPLLGEVGTVTLRGREEQALELDGEGILAAGILASPDRGDVTNLWLDDAGRLLVAARSVAGLSAVRGRRIRIGLKPGEDPPPPPGVESFRLRFAGPGGVLAGTFSRPSEDDGPRPAVLLLAGSGPQDRNGNAPGTELQWNPLETIAMALADAGIASLRYDERGVARSGGDFATAGFSDFLADARAALDFLESREDVDAARVGVVGHSEGALLGARLADGSGLRALVLVGAPAEPLDRILVEQVKRRLRDRGTPDGRAWRVLGDLRAFFEHVRLSTRDTVAWNGHVRPVRWLREHLEIDPLAVYARIPGPVLFLSGERDLQVPAEHAERAAAAAPKGEVRRLPGLDHFLMRSRDGIRDYADTHRRIPGEALTVIADWLAARLGVR